MLLKFLLNITLRIWRYCKAKSVLWKVLILKRSQFAMMQAFSSNSRKFKLNQKYFVLVFITHQLPLPRPISCFFIFIRAVMFLVEWSASHNTIPLIKVNNSEIPAMLLASILFDAARKFIKLFYCKNQ